MGRNTRKNESEAFDVSEAAIAETEGGGTAPEVNLEVNSVTATSGGSGYTSAPPAGSVNVPAEERTASKTVDLRYTGKLAIAGIYVHTEEGAQLLGYVERGGVLRNVPRELAEIALRKNRKDLRIEK